MDSTHSSSTNSLPQIDKLTLDISGLSASSTSIPHSQQYRQQEQEQPLQQPGLEPNPEATPIASNSWSPPPPETSTFTTSNAMSSQSQPVLPTLEQIAHNRATATPEVTSPLRLPQPVYHPDVEPRQRRPPPQPLRSSSSRLRSGHRSQLMTDIPSSADYYGPAGPSSASPSSWSIASSDTAPSSASSVIESRVRFERLPQGGHRHHLSAPKRQQFLANQVRRLRELLDGRRDKDDHSPNSQSQLQPQQQQQQQHGQHQLKPEVFEHPLSLLNEKYQDLDTDSTGSPASSHRRRHSVKTDFLQKYGELQQIIGKGAFGTVRISVKRNFETGEEHVFAIKEFKYAHGESQKMYMRRLTSEFCIASSLKHTNVIQTMDLLQLHGDTYSEVMEYCAGGDMHSLIASANTLGESESNCFFSQLINGVAFLHSMGVVHRDLKPENLLLTSDGCLKIADFGNSEVFRMPWEKKVRSSTSIRGSGPFIAPEEFTSETFDARKVDMWACGVIYMCMRLGRYTWHEASDGDPIWDGFLYRRDRYLSVGDLRSSGEFSSQSQQQQPPHSQGSQHSQQSDQQQLQAHHIQHAPHHVNLTSLEQVSHITLGWPNYILDVIEHLLEPDTRKRWQAIHVLDSEWLQHIDNCHPATRPAEQVLDESEFQDDVHVNVCPSQRVGSKVVPEEADVTGCKIVKEVRERRFGAATNSGSVGDGGGVAPV
ncbi:serine/threonine-protein kinase HAL4/sat4 [Mortierella sp. AD032]|nr:serine/threonine-protein kinase HAL4/sat4 [Mortierella sp. AD032]